ncbi:MAG: hypothetical protein GEU83_11465 [Pseudonocardiaceae bacterium]|nr:hypothetical protein [Pseudonocardiaceae bacterium]
MLDAGARGAAAVLLGAPALAACTDRQTPPAPDPLEPVARRAVADARLAATISNAHPSLAAAAAAVAADRRAHAAAVRAELRRVRPTPAPSSVAAAPPSSPPVPTDTAAARGELAAALRAAQGQAATVVESAPGHRAGLLASIAACCASHRAVLP